MKAVLKKFYCEKCKLIFEGIPRSKEFINPVYGPCTTLISDCPKCSNEVSEYYKPKPKVSSTNKETLPCGKDSCACCM